MICMAGTKFAYRKLSNKSFGMFEVVQFGQLERSGLWRTRYITDCVTSCFRSCRYGLVGFMNNPILQPSSKEASYEEERVRD